MIVVPEQDTQAAPIVQNLNESSTSVVCAIYTFEIYTH